MQVNESFQFDRKSSFKSLGKHFPQVLVPCQAPDSTQDLPVYSLIAVSAAKLLDKSA